MKALYILLLVGFVSFGANAQTDTDDHFRKEYEARLRKTHIDGIYIPKDLKDCFVELNKLMSPPNIEHIKSLTEDEFIEQMGTEVGQFMVDYWGLREGSRLSVYFKNIGLSYPDDITDVILITYHRDLNGKDLGLKQVFTKYKEQRAQIIEDKKKRAEERKKAKEAAEATGQ